MMNVREVLEFVDDAVHLKTGKHLNDLQRGIIEGTLKRQKYADIAEHYGCSEGHAKDIGYELLRLLSDVFDEPVGKGNLKSVLERQGNLNISLGERSINSNIIGCVNIGSEQPIAASNFQQAWNQAKMVAVKKLQQFGLGDEQIAETLDLPLEVIKQVNLEE
jgi:hypothetical protein